MTFIETPSPPFTFIIQAALQKSSTFKFFKIFPRPLKNKEHENLQYIKTEENKKRE
jgi:hypothetical protein